MPEPVREDVLIFWFPTTAQSPVLTTAAAVMLALSLARIVSAETGVKPCRHVPSFVTVPATVTVPKLAN